MRKLSKRIKAIREKLQERKDYSLTGAIDFIKSCGSEAKTATKFDQTIEVVVRLGIDPRKDSVRGATVLPNGTGKKVRVAVFAQGAAAEAAKKAGADLVGLDDLAESIKAGNMDFDVVIASPDTMAVVGRLGQVLGPRGLMPNPKVGTVTPDVAGAVKNAKAGQVQFRNDKEGNVHCIIGKLSFESAALEENYKALLADIKKAKPQTNKGIYIKRVYLSSTMGPGLALENSAI